MTTRSPFDPAGTVTVLGFPFTIAANDALEGEGMCGRFQEHRQRVEVMDGIAPDAMAETVLHELLHAVEFATGADLRERQVVALSRGLYALCRDNPDYMKALLFG